MVPKYWVKDFKHKIGHHCESSSMRDLFEYFGFPISEAMAFGLDGTLGFGYFERSERVNDLTEPFFVGGKQDTINPNSLACRLLGMTLRKQSFSSADKGWEEAKSLLNQDIPLILQVDIGYLPYEDFKDEIHFGGHTITLGGYDDENGVAFVGDTEFEGFQDISIEQLKVARSSEKGSSYLWPKNAQYSISPRTDGKRPPFAAAVKVAIQKVCNHMLRPSITYHGVQGLERFSKAILNWKDILKGTIKNPYSQTEHKVAPLMFDLIYNYIENWGTGGGCFRKLYAEFLEELKTHPEIKEGPKKWTVDEMRILESCISKINESARKWTEFAHILKEAGEKYQNDCLNHVNMNDLSELIFSILILEKELFSKLSKLKN